MAMRWTARSSISTPGDDASAGMLSATTVNGSSVARSTCVASYFSNSQASCSRISWSTERLRLHIGERAHGILFQRPGQHLQVEIAEIGCRQDQRAVDQDMVLQAAQERAESVRSPSAMCFSSESRRFSR